MVGIVSQRDRDTFDRQLSHRLSRVIAPRRRLLLSRSGESIIQDGLDQSTVNQMEDEIEEQLAALLFLVFMASANATGFSAENLRSKALVYSQTRAATTAARFSANTQKRLRQIAQRHGDNPETAKAQAVNVLGRSRVMGVVSTEVTDALTQGQAEIRQAAEEEIRKGDPGFSGFVEVWRLGPCMHCEFCPLVADTDRSFWGRFVAGGPPVHVFCCCRIQLEDARTFKIKANLPDDGQVRAAADRSGVFL